MRAVAGLENGLNLPKHMAEHIYMFSGDSVLAKFRAAKEIISEIIDWFGVDIKFSNNTDETIDVSVTVNEYAMLFWALQYGLHVEVLEPIGLREKIKNAIVEMANNYKAK
jgi:predicted DNA-binding transcriptional regulator YafY